MDEINKLKQRIKDFEEKEKIFEAQAKALAEANANAGILMAELQEKNVKLKESGRWSSGLSSFAVI